MGRIDATLFVLTPERQVSGIVPLSCPVRVSDHSRFKGFPKNTVDGFTGGFGNVDERDAVVEGEEHCLDWVGYIGGCVLEYGLEYG